MRSARRDCKEHNLQGLIHNNINGHQLQMFCDQIRDGDGGGGGTNTYGWLREFLPELDGI